MDAKTEWDGKSVAITNLLSQSQLLFCGLRNNLFTNIPSTSQQFLLEIEARFIF